tara:strand:+ start:705 stop:2519 length:1815 start_codon:yes stop_codon:yes gene_type:complete
MDNYVFEAPWSLCVTYLIILSNYVLGHYIFKFKSINLLFKNISDLLFQKILVGQLVLMIVLFPLIIFIGNAKLFFIFFMFLNILLVFFYIFELISKKKIYNNLSLNLQNKYFILFVSLITFYFLIASSPITDADSLDYHYGAAINILNNDQFILEKEWFTLAQAGRGEFLIAYGLLFGAEQYGSLIQFSGLLSISGILIKTSENKQIFKSKYFLSIIVLTSPVLLFLANSAKPQLFFSACLLIVLALIFQKNFNRFFFLKYTIINILIFTSMTGKFSFYLSGFLLWSLATFRFFDKKKLFNLVMISFLVFLSIYMPYIFWKWSEYGGNMLNYFISPFPLHLPGYSEFFDSVKAPQGFGLKFPYFLVFTDSISRITETLGFSFLLVIYLIFCKKGTEVTQIFIIILAFVLIANLYSSPSARYFFDIILWIAFSFKFIHKNKNLNFVNIFFYIQISSVLLILIYSVINFFPGSITKNQYERVKHNHAYDYSAIKWTNDKIKNEKAVIFARSISHSGNYMSGIFLNFTEEKNLDFYKKLIKEKKIKYYVTFGSSPSVLGLENCLDGLYLKEENIGYTSFRNPFANKNTYNGYIYKIDYDKLPLCKSK